MNDKDKITQQELATALIRMGLGHQVNSTEIFESVLAHREPEWEGGEVVRDANNVWWRRSRAAASWYRFGYSEDFAHSKPVRPLTVLGKERP